MRRGTRSGALLRSALVLGVVRAASARGAEWTPVVRPGDPVPEEPGGETFDGASRMEVADGAAVLFEGYFHVGLETQRGI